MSNSPGTGWEDRPETTRSTGLAPVAILFERVRQSKIFAVKCAGCGRINPEGARFCNECGNRLDGAAAAASPQKYTPQHLAEKILTSGAALVGERKQVTVLFADLKGSMELLAGRDPEEARRLLDAVLERMLEAVHRYEGLVNQVMGDGIMALFGAPLAHEDHAVRASYAALVCRTPSIATPRRRDAPMALTSRSALD